MLVEQIKTTPVVPHDVSVISATYGSGTVEIILESPSADGRWRVRFYGVQGMRVLDEGDLLEFWPACSSPKGPFFLVSEGGWKDQESERWGFLLRETRPQLPEYFVAGENACVSVLAYTPPEIFTSP
jgi:hypothetical protein